MVAVAAREALREPSSRISQASLGLSSYFLRRACMGWRTPTSASAAQLLHSIHPMPALRQPASTLAIVVGSLKILCKSPTGDVGIARIGATNACRIGDHGLEFLPNHGLGTSHNYGVVV